jgi:SAM-dependent methyltransferase
MRRVVYWPATERLVYLDAKATPEFWDARWRAEGRPLPLSPGDPVLRVTPRYLPRGSRVLEGGCGRANKVKAMADAGYRAVGIDFAEQSVSQAKIDYPGLDIRLGDVRSLDIPDGSFDGYWSIGVIEHFWKGYGEILTEAARILRPRGFLFLTAPWFSPYRQRKSRAGGYPQMDFDSEPELFYQFALSGDEIRTQLAAHGFELLLWRGLASEISMKEDMTAYKGQVDWLLGTRGSIVKRVLRRIITAGLNPYCGHSFLAVARRA